MEVKILDAICTEYGISPKMFLSDYKFGNLTEARQLFVAVLSSAGKRNKEIAEITGYSPPRIHLMLKSATLTMAKLPYFKKKHDALLKRYHAATH